MRVHFAFISDLDVHLFSPVHVLKNFPVVVPVSGIVDYAGRRKAHNGTRIAECSNMI